MDISSIRSQFTVRPRPLQLEANGGMEVYVRPLTVGERLDFLELAKNKELKAMYSRLVSVSVVDQKGNAIFSASEVDGLDSVIVEELTEKLSVLNGITDAKKAPSPDGQN